MIETLHELRLAYEKETNPFLAMPLAGALIWLVIAIFGYLHPVDGPALDPYRWR